MSLSEQVGVIVDRRRILAVALPALVTLAADPLLSLVDTAFVGRLGTVQLGALGVDAAIFGFAFAVFNFLAYATTPMVARARGRGLIAESGRVVKGAIRLAWVIGAVGVTVLVLGSNLWLSIMQASDEIFGPATEYLRIRAWALPAVLLITAANGAYRGFEDTRTPLKVTLLVNLINVGLDPLLMFGLGWGIRGAAWATLIAQWVGAGWFLVLLGRRGRVEGWPGQAVSMAEMLPLIRLGSVLILRTLMLVVSLTAATAVATRVGTVAVAAHQVIGQVWFLMAMIIDALAIAAQTLVASLLGAGHDDQARLLTRGLLKWGFWIGVGLGVILVLAGSGLGGWFSDDPAVVAAVRAVVPTVALMQPAAALVFVFDGAYMAVPDARLLARSTLVGMVSIAIVLGLTLGFGWGLNGVWWGVTAMIGGRLVVLGGRYLRTPGTLVSR